MVVSSQRAIKYESIRFSKKLADRRDGIERDLVKALDEVLRSSCAPRMLVVRLALA